MKTCKQHGCVNQASYRYTWPGRDESYICESHLLQLRGIAEAMGVYVQTIPLSDAELDSAED